MSTKTTSHHREGNARGGRGRVSALSKGAASSGARNKTSKGVVLKRGVPGPMGPYSHAVVASGFVFVSGQGPRDPTTGKHVQGGIKEQTVQAVENIRAILESMGLGLSDVVKTNAYLGDIRDFQSFNEVYGKFFKSPFPARTTIQAVLPAPGILVEIEVIARMRENRTMFP